MFRKFAIYLPVAVCTIAALMNLSIVNHAPADPPSPSSVESTFLSNVRQVTSTENFLKAGEGYFSPDGKRIIFQATTEHYPDFYQIYTMPLEGGEPKLVSTGRGRTTCSYFSPDGKKIVYASSHRDPYLTKTEQAARKQAEEDAASGRRRRYTWDFDTHMDIYEADTDGGNRRRLTTAYGYDAEGAYSRDGKKIAFASSRAAPPDEIGSSRAVDLYVMNSDGSDLQRLTDAPGYDGGPFISPDGKWVVFRSDRDKPEYLQIYVIGIDGKNEVKLTETDGVNWGPYWHPTKPYIIWSGADHSQPGRPNYDLWLVKYSTAGGKFTITEPMRVTDNSAADVLPVFSPDGKKLMWTSTRTKDHSSQLWIADFKGG